MYLLLCIIKIPISRHPSFALIREQNSAMNENKVRTYEDNEEQTQIIFKKLKKWAENDYLLRTPGPLAVPSVAEIYTYAKKMGFGINKQQIRKFRNQLEVVSKYKCIGNTFKKRNALFLSSFVPRTGWVHLDVGFIGKNRKKYGEFLIAVDTLSQRVKIKTFAKHAKSRNNLQNFIIELMSEDPWKNTYRIVTDGEAGISTNAINFLESRYPELRIIKLDYNINTKAFYSERKIRSFKSKLSRFCLVQKIPLFKWRIQNPKVGGIPAKIVEEALNNTKIVGTFTPNNITQANEQKFIEELIDKKKKYAYTFLYGLSVPQDTKMLDKLFKFKEKDKVLVALTEHPDPRIRRQQWKKKATIVGHFDKKSGVFIIVWRTLTISANLYLACHYRIKDEGGTLLPRIYHQDFLRLYSP